MTCHREQGDVLTRIPTKPTDDPSNPSIQHPSNNQKKTRKTSHIYTLAPTFDIPFGSNSTSAKSTSPAGASQQEAGKWCAGPNLPCLMKSFR